MPPLSHCKWVLKIDAVAALILVSIRIFVVTNMKAEIKLSASLLQRSRVAVDLMGQSIPALSLVVWTLKREVRAFGGCLGMHRR